MLSEILKNNVETKTVISLDQISQYVPIITKKQLVESFIYRTHLLDNERLI